MSDDDDDSDSDGALLGCLFMAVFSIGLVVAAGVVCGIIARAAAWGWSLVW